MKKIETLAVIAFCALAAPAQASYVVNIQQVGANVTATGSGSINLAGLSLIGPDNSDGASGVRPFAATMILGPPGPFTLYTGISGPTSLGPGDTTVSTSFTGVFFGFNGTTGNLGVPVGYVSGSSLGTSSDLFANATISSLGLNPGTYIYSFGSGRTADTLTINVSGVPEPATWAMMLLGFGAIGASLRRRKATAMQIA